MQSRYDKGDGADYINCPMNADEYDAFIAALLAGEKTDFKEWEKSTPYFEGCLPIEVMASRGPETLRFGPMKPVGLHDPRKCQRPHAVVQLRQDNALGTLWNMVGFQTKLKHGEQTRIFRMIPGLQERDLRAARRTASQHLHQLAAAARFATASEDAAWHCASPDRSRASRVMSRALRSACWPAALRLPRLLGRAIEPPPPTTALGALLAHITGGADARTFQPMNVNFGLFPEPPARTRGKDRKRAQSHRAHRRSRRLAGSSEGGGGIDQIAQRMAAQQQPHLLAMLRDVAEMAQRLERSSLSAPQVKRHKRSRQKCREKFARNALTARRQIVLARLLCGLADRGLQLHVEGPCHDLIRRKPDRAKQILRQIDLVPRAHGNGSARMNPVIA